MAITAWACVEILPVTCLAGSAFFWLEHIFFFMMLVQGQIPSFPGVNKSAMCNLSTTEGTSPYIECKRDFPLMKKKKS